jgi:hypothetical protein
MYVITNILPYTRCCGMAWAKTTIYGGLMTKNFSLDKII